LTTHKQVKHNTPKRCAMILSILIIERTMKTSTTPKGAASDPGSFIFSKKLLSYKRCSRSLCSSQTTTPPHTPPTRAPINTTNKVRASDQYRLAVRLCAGNQESNNFRCCSRTQQCAKHHPPEHSNP